MIRSSKVELLHVIFCSIILLTYFVVSQCSVAQATPTFTEIAGDAVIVDNLENPSAYIYPHLDDLADMALGDLIFELWLPWGTFLRGYAGVDDWHVATIDELETFFGASIYDPFQLPGFGGYLESFWDYEVRTDTRHDNPTYVLASLVDPIYDEIQLSAGYSSANSCGPQVSAWVITQAVPAPVPEPSTFLLLICGLFGVVGLSLKHKRN